MKRIICCLLCLILLTGCESTKSISKKVVKEEKIEVKKTYKDDNNMPISFYENNKKITTKEVAFKVGYDFGGNFQIFPSNEDSVDGNWNSFYNEWIKYDSEHKIKIGYNISYSLNDGRKISHTILDPSNTMEYEGYLAIFLYDDYNNRNKSWYSHLEEKDYNDNTFITSIKLYGNGVVGDINSNIVITAFTYDTEDDFDSETKEYRGNSKATLTLIKK